MEHFGRCEYFGAAMGGLQPLRLYAGMQGLTHASGSAMPVTDSSSRELSEVASTVAEAVAPESDEVEYPDRTWIAQSVGHGDAVRLATVALDKHFGGRDDALVAMELTVYYLRGNDQVWLRPDVLVAFDVGRGRELITYKTWEAGKAPDFVLEVASPSTAENDAGHKAREYAAIGVREYWRLDPKGTLMEVPLEGYRTLAGQYERVESVVGPGGVEYLRSGVLALDFRTTHRDGVTVLVIRDPLTGDEFDGSVQEFDRRRRVAEDERDAAKGQLSALRAELKAAKEAAKDELSAKDDELSAKEDELSAKEDELSAFRERVRELERQLRDA